jgi:hypothetical protein
VRQAFLYYLVQTWAEDPGRHAQRDVPPQAPAPAGSGRRHRNAPTRDQYREADTADPKILAI